MLKQVLFILIVMAVIVVVVAVIVLAIVRLATRVERKVTRLLGGAGPRPRTTTRTGSRGGRGAPAARPATRPPSDGSAPQATPRAGPVFRIRSVFESRPEMVWHGQGATLRLHELVLASPMVYVAADRRASGTPLDPSELIASLTVDRRSPPAPATEWGTYASLHPAQRWAYLTWLGRERAALPHDPALLLLFFQGLERRALADGADLALVVQEVCRLRDLAAQAPSGGGAGARPHTAFMRQSGALLWMLVAQHPGSFSERDVRVLASRTSSWSEEALVSALAWCVRRGPDGGGGTLPAWLARVVVAEQPGARRSVVLDRVAEQFATLFDARLVAMHPGGMTLRVSKRERVLTYRPGNRTLAPAECPVPDALAIASQFGPLIELWNACIDDLRASARVPAGAAEMTLKQWAALPEDLRRSMDNPFAPALAALAGARADESGHAIVTAGELVAALRMETPERGALTPTQSQALARGVEEAGMALEPDARLVGGGSGLDAPVVLLASPIPVSTEPGAVARYLAATCVLRLGAAVALADGAAGDDELEPVAQELERAFDLSEDDHRRLDALLVLLRERGSDVRAVGKRLLGGLAEAARRGVGRLLIAVASVDGAIGDAERATLRACYRALGLSAGDLDADLGRLGASLSETPAGGDNAADMGEPRALQLDRDAVRAIMAETREVAQMLADAMRGEADDDAEPGAAAQNAPVATPDFEGTIVAPVDSGSGQSAGGSGPPALEPVIASVPVGSGGASSPMPGLSPRYAAFGAALLARASWSREEAESLAREHRHMLGGAVEAINDWAFDRAGGPMVIEEGDRLVIDEDRRRALG